MTPLHRIAPLQRIAPLVALTLLLPLVGCYKSANIEFTDPENGATDVPADLASIRIGFSTVMDQETITQADNIQIRGSLSGLWSFSASYIGEEVDEEAGEIPNVLTLTLQGRDSGSGDVDPTGTPTVPDNPDNPGVPGVPSGSPTDTFEPGEVVTVSLANAIVSSASVPLDDASFSFTIAGNQDVGPRDGEFTVLAATPLPNSTGAMTRPAIAVTFAQPVLQEDLAFNPADLTTRRMYVRGEKSGTSQLVPTLTGTASTPTSSAGGDGSPDGGDGSGDPSAGVPTATGLILGTAVFSPGERVSVTLAEGASGVGVNGAEPDILLPYAFEFTVGSGRSTGGFGAPDAPALGPGVSFSQPKAVFLIDFIRVVEGLEMVVLDGNRVTVLRLDDDRWFLVDTFDFSDTVVSLLPADFDDNGRIEVLALLASGDVQTLEADNFSIVSLEDPIVTGAVSPSGFAVADVSGNGLLDLVVSDSTGLVLLTPRFETNTDGSFTGARVTDTVDFDLDGPVANLVVGDFDEDGRWDLVTTGTTGSRIFTRASSPGEPLELAALGSLDDQAALVSFPQAADFEGDGDLDLIALASGGIQVYVNDGSGVPDSTIWTPQFLALPDLQGASFLVGNLDGDTALLSDLAVYDPVAGRVAVYRRNSLDTLSSWDRTDLEVAGSLQSTRLSAADVNGDTGLDLILIAETGADPITISLAQSVVAGTAADYGFGLPTSLEVELVSANQEFVVPVAANFVEPITAFTCSVTFDPAELEFVRVEPAPGVLSGVLLEETDTDGVVNGTVGGGVLAAQSEPGPFLQYVFRLVQPAPGSYVVQLQGEGTENPSTMTRTDDSEVTVNLDPSRVSLVVTASVPMVQDFVCEPGFSEDTSGTITNFIDLSWSLPGSPYDLSAGIRVRRNGATIAVLSGTATSFRDSNPGGSSLRYDVEGVSDGIFSAPAECSLTLIPVPTLTCIVGTGNPRNVTLEWIVPTGVVYDSIFISLDGGQIGSLSGSLQSFTTSVDAQGHVFELVATIGSDSAAPVSCSISDEDPTVAAPNEVRLSLTGELASVIWFNGEAYDSIDIFRLQGGSSEFVATLDNGSSIGFQDPAPLLPGSYRYQVVGRVDTATSSLSEGISDEETLGLIEPLDLSCVTNGGLVDLNWTNGSSLYSSIEILRGVDLAMGELPSTVIATTVSPTDTSFTDSITEDGDYTYLVRGRIGADFSDSDLCAVEVASRIRAEDVVLAPGLSGELVITADLIQDIDSFSFTLTYDPSVFEFEQVLLPAGTFVMTPTPVQDGTDPSLNRLVVSVTDAFYDVGGGIELASVLGSVPSSLAAVGSSSLTITNPELGGPPMVGRGPSAVSGVLQVSGDAVLVGEVDASPGSIVDVPVFVTLDQAIQGFTVIVQFDPSALTCLEVQASDSTLDIFSSFINVAIDNENGFAQLAGVAFTDELTPRILDTLAFFRFEVSTEVVPGDLIVGVAESHQFGMSPESSTTFATGSTIVPARFDGFVRIAGAPSAPIVDTVTPAIGSIAGGETVLIEGDFFVGDVTVTFRSIALPASDVVVLSEQSISVTTPFAGEAGLADVVVSTAFGESDPILFEYQDFFALTDAIPSVASPCEPSSIRIVGEGFPASQDVLVFVSALPTTPLLVEQVRTNEITVKLPPLGAEFTDLDFIVQFAGFPERVLSGVLQISESFVRGDFNADGVVDRDDLDALGAFLLQGVGTPSHSDAADCDDDGDLDVDDLLLLRSHLDTADPLPAPFPVAGPDPTVDTLGCIAP